MGEALPGGLLDTDGAAAVVAAWHPHIARPPAMLRVEHRRAPTRLGARAGLAAWIRVALARFDAGVPGVELRALLDVPALRAHGGRADAVLLNLARWGVGDLVAHAPETCQALAARPGLAA